MKRKITVTVWILTTCVSVLGVNPASAEVRIVKVYDGDTITLSSGEKVRLLQIDTPELSPAECYGEEARSALTSMLNQTGTLSLKEDPRLDKVDRYGRLLRYLFIGKTNINLKMVEVGAAAPYFYKGDKGLYSSQILKAAESAKARSLGLWKKCPGSQLFPSRAISTVNVVQKAISDPKNLQTRCDNNYAGCIPVFASDVDCTDIKQLGLAPVQVVGIDVHKLDRDGDGIGCDK
jgi:micrococcal nuclease